MWLCPGTGDGEGAGEGAGTRGGRMAADAVTLAMSTPVIFRTNSGTVETMERTSPVSLAAPISPEPLETIVIFLA